MHIQSYLYRKSIRIVISQCALVSAVLFVSIQSHAATFEARADSFSLGGILVEEYDSASNTFDPWLGGTVTYQDGYAVFTDPGILITPSGATWSHEFSGITYQNEEGGGSDFIAQSLWSSAYLPGESGGSFGQYFYDYSLGEGLSISLSNNSQAFSDLTGYAAGLGISFTRTTGDGTLLSTHSISLTEEDLAGDIAFELSFDVTSGMIEGLFSTDGGTTFNSMGSYSSTGYGRHVLHGSHPVFSPVPIPAAAWLFGSALLGLGVFKRRKA